MTDDNGSWLLRFARSAERSDRFAGRPDHRGLLAAGLMGEAGSMLAELKKKRRELNAYPAYRRRMHEETGDFLWYFVRLAEVAAPGILASLNLNSPAPEGAGSPLSLFLELGAAVGEVLAVLSSDKDASVELQQVLGRVWNLLQRVTQETSVDLRDAAGHNTRKTASRWPTERTYATLFDEEFAEEEQLPRHLDIEFRERDLGARKAVILRCNQINFGDRLTDNIEDPDGYRYHDIFHFAHAVYLGWSPVVRALLKCKRKSSPKKDEGQDGARAVILEEAISAIIFSRAKQLSFFDQLDHVDYDLLKTTQEFVQGFEVSSIPLWQWEEAILRGYEIFRMLRSNRGGRVTLNLANRELTYLAAP